MRQPVLNVEDHEHFIEHGYVVLRGIVPASIAAAAVATLEDDDGDPRHRADAVAACTTDSMLDAIADLFGDSYTLTRRRGGSDLARVYQPEAAWPEPRAHVDDSYPTIMPGGWAVGSFTFLTQVQSHGGAFVYFAGAYRRYRALMARSCECIKGAAQLPQNSGPHQEFLAAPGDVLLFHHLAGHTGSDNIVDPVTRHALLNRWHPEERIVPGDKPFDEMTTIEKVNSARYQAYRSQAAATTPISADDGATTAALVAGIAPWPAVRSYAILHFDGRQHLFHCHDTAACRIHHAVSDDGITWETAPPIELGIGDVGALHVHQYGLDAILGVTTTDGNLHLFSSLDLRSWQALAIVSGVHTATPWFVYAQYPSKVAGGQAVFVVPQHDTASVVCRWGERWNDAGQWTTQSVALRTPEGQAVHDLTIAAHFGDSSCAFVVDLDDGCGGTLPYYAQPQDVAVADEPLQPLPYDCDRAPRNLRILHRARSYWLVTYLRNRDDGDRLFWGCIDWRQAQPVLQELTTAAEMHEAWCTVGFI
jgi:hypothetical protein